MTRELLTETPGERWLRKYTTERDTLIDANAYDPADEKDSCGVGLVAQIDGTPRREVVEMAIRALKAVFHRGAVDADGKTGDGAGIRVDVPQDFFRDAVRGMGHTIASDKQICVGQIFQIGRASCRERGRLTCRSRWSPYH